MSQRELLLDTLARSGRLMGLTDMCAATHRPQTGRILEEVRRLSFADASRRTVQQCVRSITSLLLPEAFPVALQAPVVLVPVLRAGVAMWATAADFFPDATTAFVTCSKSKGTTDVAITWHKTSPTPKAHVVILDTVLASGDTVASVCAEALARFEPLRELTVLTCYAAPEGVSRVLDRCPRARVFAACLSETVGADGYLVPRINGDMGDKLFGS